MGRRRRKCDEAGGSPGDYVWLEAVDHHHLVRPNYSSALLEGVAELQSLFFGLLLSALETSIIATALVSISSSLGGSDKSNWVVTAYLITYTGMYALRCRPGLCDERLFDLYADFEVRS